MRTCTALNRDGNQCRAHVVPGTDQCRYHTATSPGGKARIIVKRSDNGGGAALKALILACQKHRTPFRPAYSTIGTGPDRGKPKFKDWMFVDSVEPCKLYGSYRIELSNGKSMASHNLFAAMVSV